MKHVSVSDDVKIRFSEEEVADLTKAYNILKELDKELWQNEVDDVDAVGYIDMAEDGIFYLMRDCGINIDEKRVCLHTQVEF